MVKQAIGIWAIAIALALPAFADRFETGELDPKLDPDVAGTLTNATITLRGTIKADVAYNVICERAGIDVIFDPSFEPQKMWVDIGGASLSEALELVRIQSHTAWRAVAPHTIVVIPVSPPKNRIPTVPAPEDVGNRRNRRQIAMGTLPPALGQLVFWAARRNGPPSRTGRCLQSTAGIG